MPSSYELLGIGRDGRARKNAKTRRPKKTREARRQKASTLWRFCLDAVVAAAFWCIDWLPFLSLSTFDLVALVASVWVCAELDDDDDHRGTYGEYRIDPTVLSMLSPIVSVVDDNASLSLSRPSVDGDGDGSRRHSATAAAAAAASALRRRLASARGTLTFLRICLGGLSLAKTLYRIFRGWQFVADLRTTIAAERLLIVKTTKKNEGLSLDAPFSALRESSSSSSPSLPPLSRFSLSSESLRVVKSADFRCSLSLDAAKERRLAVALARFGMGESGGGGGGGGSGSGSTSVDGRECRCRIDRSSLAFSTFECLWTVVLVAAAISHWRTTTSVVLSMPSCRSLLALSAISASTVAARYAACIFSFCDSEREL